METNWDHLALSPSTNLREALAVIDRGAMRLGLVIDENRFLLGTLSDGDVRRALIKGLSLEEPVLNAMNRNPRTAHVSTDRSEVLITMEKHDLLVIPIIDDQKRLMGLFSHKEFLKSSRKDNWVFLMAGGYGTRLRPLTDQCPKPMLQIGGKPLLQIILERCLSAGFHKFYISVHYMAEMIKEYFGDGGKWNASIRYIEEEKPLGTAGSLGLLPDVEGKPLLMMNGDVLSKVDIGQLLRFHIDNQSELTMCVREYDFTVPYGVVETAGRHVTTITEKPVHRFFVNAGIYALSPNVASGIKPNTRIDMPELADQLIKQGKDVSVFPLHEYWLDIGRPDDFLRAQEEIETGPFLASSSNLNI